MSLVDPLLRQMTELDIPRDWYLYTALIKGYGGQGWLDKVQGIEREIREMGRPPDLVTVNSMLDAYARCGELKKVKALLQEMIIGDESSESILPKPDIYSYNTVLKAMAQAKDLTAALKLHREMEAAGIEIDPVTINTLIFACTKAGLMARGYRILGKNGSIASVEGYTTLLDGFVDKGNLGQVGR